MCCLYIVPFVDIHFPQKYVRNMGPNFKDNANCTCQREDITQTTKGRGAET